MEQTRRDRLLDIARHACALSRLRRMRPGATSLEVFVDFRDRLRTEPQVAAAQLA